MRNEWQKHPIDCRYIAAIAGAHHKEESLIGIAYGKGRVVYCRGHIPTINNAFSALADAGPCVWITASSDSSVTDELAGKLPPNVIRWFAVNNESTNERVESFPIGFSYNAPRFAEMIQQVNKPWGKYCLLYVCFSAHRRVLARKGVYEKFANLPWVVAAGAGEKEIIPADAFYAMMKSSHYVLSPPGAGPDCHRTWEAMALGSVPIVLRSNATRILDDMPCMQVDSWDEVTQKKLEEDWGKLAGRFEHPSIRKLSVLYWSERIWECLS